MISRLFLIAIPILSSLSGAQSQSQSQNVSTTLITTSVPKTTTSTSGSSQIVSTFFVSTTIVSTVTPVPTNASSPSSSTTAAPSSTQTGPPPVKLDTVLDPAFGVLGALLIITGLPSAFLGHKNRWSSYFLTGFYTLSGICLALILKFGVLPSVNPPSRSLRGLFVLSCGIAGLGGGALSILFWGQAKYFVGALGGFAFGMWVQCFRNGGVIRPIGLRWVLYIACGVVGFILCTIPKIHYQILLASTAIVGATAFMLGVDCYTLVGLKEFYVYNLGFKSLFLKFANMPFPVSQTMQIELGLIAATALAGMAIQLRVLAALQLKLKQIKADQKRRNEEVEARAAERFAAIEQDLQRWEKEHGRASTPAFLKGSEDTPVTPGGLSDDTLIGKRTRLQSNLSSFVAPPLDPDDGYRDRRQSLGPLPVMNLGNDIEETLPTHLINQTGEEAPTSSLQEVPEPARKEKEAHLADIEEIRKSIDWLKSNSPVASAYGDSRRVSTSSRPLTLNQDISSGMAFPSVLSSSGRPRVQSMDILSNFASMGEIRRTVERTTSTPLRDEDWDAYVLDRRLFTPPSGISAPIPTSERPRSTSMLLAIPESVKDALAGRRRRESTIEQAIAPDPVGGENLTKPNAEIVIGESLEANSRIGLEPLIPPSRAHKRSQSMGNMPVEILPPQKRETIEELPGATRTRTFEELAERHRRKIRDLQNPLSQAEKEQATLEAAKSRWEKSKQSEKEDFQKRQAEKAATLAAKEKSTQRNSKGGSAFMHMTTRDRTSRALTPDKLATTPPRPSGRRSSTAKVLEWQRYQQMETEAEVARATSPSQSKRRSPQTQIQDVVAPSSDVPFPGTSRPPREASARRRG